MTDSRQCPAFDLAKLNSDHGSWAAYREMRRSGAVARSEQYGGYWALINYAAVREVATDTNRFCSGQGATIPSFGNPMPVVPLEVDPPDHRSYRRLLVPALRPDRAEEWADDIRAITDECIDEFIETGTADLAVELAHRVPPVIIAKILGLAGRDVEMFVGLTREINETVTTGDTEANKMAMAAFVQYVEQKVTEARGTDANHLIARVANAEIDGEPIEYTAAIGTVLTLIVAGHETTVNGISSLLWLVGAHPDVKQRLIEDPSRISAAVEEALRLESPVQMLGRTLTEDVEVDGVRMKAGDKIGLVWGAANHDEAKFAHPDIFDIDRPGNPHLAFGHGIHRCIGEHLARTEMRIVLEQILTRIPDYTIDGDVAIGTEVVFNRGPKNVPVAFTPGVRADV